MSDRSTAQNIARWLSRSFSAARIPVALALLTLALVPATTVSAQESSSGRKLVERIDPGYPELAKRNRIVGNVRLRVLIGPDGRPKNVEILGGNPVLADTARDSVMKWKWSPSDHESTEVVEVRFDAHT